MRIRPKKSGSETEQKSPDADPTLCLLADSNVGKILTILTLTPKKYISNFANNFLLNFISFLFYRKLVYDKNWTKNTFFLYGSGSATPVKKTMSRKYMTFYHISCCLTVGKNNTNSLPTGFALFQSQVYRKC